MRECARCHYTLHEGSFKVGQALCTRCRTAHDPAQQRQCSGCHEIKANDEFHKSKRAEDVGYSHECWDCRERYNVGPFFGIFLSIPSCLPCLQAKKRKAAKIRREHRAVSTDTASLSHLLSQSSGVTVETPLTSLDASGWKTAPSTAVSDSLSLDLPSCPSLSNLEKITRLNDRGSSSPDDSSPAKTFLGTKRFSIQSLLN